MNMLKRFFRDNAEVENEEYDDDDYDDFIDEKF